MEVIRRIEDINAGLRGCILTIGNFDGVHLAHRKIICSLVDEARRAGTPGVVMTFEPHPQQVLHPERIPFYLITTLEEKLAALEELGADAAVVVPFSREFSATPAESFVRDIIWKRLRPSKVLIGHDYTFGKGKEGKPPYFKIMGRELGFDVDIVEAVLLDGNVVSSTRVRNAVFNGDVEEAARLLGRPFSFEGTVVEGDKRGAGIGFPTANLRTAKDLIPRTGVYAALSELSGGFRPSVVNIGFVPTFVKTPGAAPLIEAHILDFREDLYGKNMRLHFFRRLRGERKFDGAVSLTEQIRKDIEAAREILPAAAPKPAPCK